MSTGARCLNVSGASFAALVAIAFLLAGGNAFAEDEKKADKPGESKPAKAELVQTTHSVTINGKPIKYQATAGTLPLKEEDGKVTANVFFIAYTKLDENPEKRPLTFTFNGGPGSSSVWLHMGAFGPKRVAMTDDGEPLPPPVRLVENDLSILDLTDLVFIDPVTTGFSRPASGTDAKRFHGVEQDIQSVGEFIRLYTTRYQRWGSPKFVAGESYGTTRASALSGYLQDRLGMNLSGVVLISVVLNFETIRFDTGNDLPYVLFLPAYTATAWYHKKLSSELQKDLSATLEEAKKFAEGEYATALLAGDKLSESERKKIAAKLARYTGLSEQFVESANLRVEIMRFTKELLRNDRRTVGRFDSRLKGIDSDAAGERHEYDPSYTAVLGTYTAGFNEYVRHDLKYESDAPYEILTGRVQPWDFGDAKNRYLNVAPTLAQAMTKNRNLKLFVASGYFDLATPFFATDYTRNHLHLEEPLAKHITATYYEAGHMMYIQRTSHVRLKKDLAKFYEDALSP
jgi:carboxypeptidase C (cathepsin A)